MVRCYGNVTAVPPLHDFIYLSGPAIARLTLGSRMSANRHLRARKFGPLLRRGPVVFAPLAAIEREVGRQEFQRLTELAAGADNTADAINNTTPQPFQIETVGPGELNSRDRATAVAMFRDAGLEDGVIAEAFNGGRVTRKEVAAAKALQSARHGDAGWRERFLAGGWAENREQTLINIILTSAIDESR